MTTPNPYRVDDLEKAVNYCYRCGKKVNRERGSCWYCSAPTLRVIRPPRRCPFCEQKVGPRAVKCHHCGEFIDGRPRVQPQNLTFVIDKAVIGPQGQLSAPPQAYAIPDASRSLEGGPPPMLGDRQQTLLPAPNGDDGQTDLHDSKLLPSSDSVTRERRRPDPGSALAPYGGTGHALAPREKGSALAPYEPGGAMAPYQPGGALAPYQPPPAPMPPPPPAPPPPPVDDSKYGVCPICDSETLRSDNYCFHCGQVLQVDKKTAALLAEREMGSNWPLHMTAILMFGVYVCIGDTLGLDSLQKYNSIAYRGSAAALGFAMLGWAFFHRRKFFSQLLTLILAALAAFVVIAF